MAKEMIIIFVYDTQILKKEDDDPASAILYFHPSWVSDQQKTSLCGQIMGTVHCLKSVLKCPKIVSLYSGKFYIKEYGRYTLAVGTDRNISNWVLEHRANTLSSLISFFHHDLQAMAELYNDNTNLSAKLYHMFETYLKLLLYGGNMFSNIATVQLPKSASNVFLEAIQILQSCQEYSYVLGGTLLYHNKVVATQIGSNLTKRLVLTDPYRIKSPAEIVDVNFQLPLGVQLLYVYVDGKEYSDLKETATKYQTVFQNLSKKYIKKVSSKPASIKEPIASAMKRDQSLIFTAVPEEDADHHSPINIENTFVNKKLQNRPKSLNLRMKTTDTNEDKKKSPESTVVPSTPYLGQTSVCSTPMTDIKRVLHWNAVSICTGLTSKENSTNSHLKGDICDSFKTDSINSILSAVSENSHTSLHSQSNIEKVYKTTPYITISSNPFDKKRSFSMWDVREKLKNIAKRITMKYYSLGPETLSQDLHTSLELSESSAPVVKLTHKTITDPTFPVFRYDGNSISQSLYESYVKMHLNFINSELRQETLEINPNNTKLLEEFDSAPRDIPKRPSNIVQKSSDIELQLINKNEEEKPSQKTRRSLSLPLKSLTKSDSSDGIFSLTNRSRYGSGVQLTPLMSKLSILAMEEKSSGFCSRSTTPSEYKDFVFTPTQSNYLKLTNSNTGANGSKSDRSLKKCILFVCGQQDTVMNILLEENACTTSEIVHNLWNICTEHLGKLERQLQHCLESYPGSSHTNNETYSYLCMDPEWDTIQRGGPWGGPELGALTHLHRDFLNASNLMEIILRAEDGIIYGHHCGSNEVYYHQPASSAAGLPTPADLMGSVPLKARRRLERDHAIMLL